MQSRQMPQIEHVAHVASDVTGKLGEKVDEGREQAAASIKSAAYRLRKRANHGGVSAQAGERLAEGMERTADYLHKPEKKRVLGRVKSYVFRRHPKRSILGAILAAFIIGRIIT